MGKSEQQSKAKVEALFQELEQVAGEDPHHDGAMAKIALVLKKAMEEPNLRETLRDMAYENQDIYGTLEKPGFGMAGITSAKIGYREPHDHGSCWAINVQLEGKLRLVHWERASEDGDKIMLRRGSEVLMGPGDVDCSPPGVAHELFPETEDSVEMAVRCHSLASVIQNRYDRKTGSYKKWSWAKKAAVGIGEFTVQGGDRKEELPVDFANRI